MFLCKNTPFIPNRDKVSNIFSLLLICFYSIFLFVGAKLRLISNNIIHYICVIIVDICTNADKWRLCLSMFRIFIYPGFTQKECVEFCKKNNILVEAWSSLGKGNVLDNPLLKSIATNHGKSVAQVVIRWVMQTGVLPLVKSVTPSRIKENVDVFDFELSQQEMLEIASMKDDRIGADPDTCDF